MSQIPPPLPPPMPSPAAPSPVIPYAGPATNLAPPPPQFQPSAWRDGTLLVVPAMAALPPRCVKCNADATVDPGCRRIRLNLAWHHPGWYFLILAGVLVYAIVALCLQQKATVQLSLCPTHAKKRARWLLVAWTSAIVGIGLMIFGCAGGGMLARSQDMWPFWCIIGGIVLAIVGAIVGILGARVLLPKRIELGYAWLSGAHPEFLAMFPDARQG